MCNGCKRRFTTYERVVAPSLKVVKRSGAIEQFDFDKLRRCLLRVGRGRPLRDDDVSRIARDIEARLLDSGAKTVRSSQIVALALDRLVGIDKLAYDRLAANYLDEQGRLRIEPRATLDDGEVAQLGLFNEAG